MSDFYKYFKENMDYLNMPCPEALFSSFQVASGTAMTLVGLVDKFGTRVTVREAVLATTGLERLAIITALSASAYAGAIIGSLAVASGRSLSNGTSLADVLFMARRLDIKRDWLLPHLQRVIVPPNARPTLRRMAHASE